MILLGFELFNFNRRYTRQNTIRYLRDNRQVFISSIFTFLAVMVIDGQKLSLSRGILNYHQLLFLLILNVCVDQISC